MKRRSNIAFMIFFCSLLLLLPCQASAQKRSSGTRSGGGGKLQSLITSLQSSKDADANFLARELKFFSQEMKKDGKDVKGLQPYLAKIEQSANAGDYEAADKALADAVGETYNIDFWKEVSFESTGGFKVYGYLTQPRSREKLPIIVLVHGGEHGSSNSYKRHAFMFSKDNFGTLAVDYRGSSNHGDAYKNAGDPAGKEIDDVVKAVEYARSLPSTTKVGLMGSSHGAFIGGNVLTRTKLVSAANLNFGGYNFKTLFEEWGTSDDPVSKKKMEVWTPILGNPPDFNKAESVSPIEHVDQINAPILLIHGKNDKVVPYMESVNMNEALKKDNKKTTLKLYPDGQHGFIFKNTKEAEDAFKMTDDFFKANLQ